MSAFLFIVGGASYLVLYVCGAGLLLFVLLVGSYRVTFYVEFLHICFIVWGGSSYFFFSSLREGSCSV